LCNRTPEGVHLQVVCKAPPAVDLHDRQPLAILRLERGIAGDVDLAKAEAELRLQLSKLLERALAEVAALGVEDDDVGGYG
jgi:hypothetical protein